MTVIKRFGEDDTALVDWMDQLVEVLVQLLEEKQDPAVKEAGDLVTRATISPCVPRATE